MASRATERTRHLTTADLSDRLGIPVRTLEGWRQRRYGPCFIRVGAQIRYRLKDVEAWEDSLADPLTA